MGGLSLSLAVVGALAAGCGGSSDATTPTSQGASLEAYTACLAQNGVTLPQNSRSPGNGQRTPGASGRPTGRPSGSFGAGQAGGGPGGGQGGGGFGGGGVGGVFGTQAPTGVDQAAWDKARKACESVMPTGGTGGGANNSANTAYRNCLTEHGVAASAGTNRLDTADPTVAAAEKACEALRPTTQPRPTPTP